MTGSAAGTAGPSAEESFRQVAPNIAEETSAGYLLARQIADDCVTCTGNEEVASEIATSRFNGQRNRAIPNEATKKAVRRAISIGWGGRAPT
jgi:hypothetical protein